MKKQYPYIVDKSTNRITTWYAGEGVRPNHLMGAWTVEYPKTHYKLYISNVERSNGYKVRTPRRK